MRPSAKKDAENATLSTNHTVLKVQFLSLKVDVLDFSIFFDFFRFSSISSIFFNFFDECYFWDKMWTFGTVYKPMMVSMNATNDKNAMRLAAILSTNMMAVEAPCEAASKILAS